jgi:Ubiquitin carboxyl-terminal hydrolase
LSEKVLLPLRLDLRALKNEDPKDVSERHYLLCAVMRHKGTSAYSGHYVAEAMDWLSGQWYEFNDQNVEHLTDGPSCSFHPDLIDLANYPTLKTDTDRPFKVSLSGSQDAYNMYYVEHSFLAKCINESLNKERFEGDLLFQPGDIVSNMTAERSQYYENVRK